MATTSKTLYNVDYVQKALAQAYKSEKLHVESLEINSKQQNGENFCSDIYRLSVKYRKSPESPIEVGKYIIKNLLPVVAEMGTSEKLMFSVILPAMEGILGKASQLKEHKLCAKCFYCDPAEDKEDYLLEDLTALDYISLDRQKGLNLHDAKICLEKLGQFHAASMVVINEKPELLTELSPSQYEEGVEGGFAKLIIVDGTEYAANVFADEMPEISAKMKAQLPKAYSARMRSVVNPENSAFNVIVHGDLWVNNIFINRAEEKALFVDFQNCCLGSPAIDLHFLFYTSLQLDVLLHQQQELLQHYFQSLTNTLKACHYAGTMPTFKQLTDEVQRCLLYGYYAAVCELPICSASKESSVGMDLSILENPEAMNKKRAQLFTNERFLQTLRAVLVTFEKEGILETP